MSLDNGSVSIADDGTVTKEGYAGLVFDEIYAQEFPLLPDPDAAAPARAPSLGDAGYVAPAAQTRAEMIRKAITSAKKIWARTAVAVAKAAQGVFATVTAGASTNLLSVTPKENTTGCYRVTVAGHDTASGATFHATYHLTYTRIATAAPTGTALTQVSLAAGGFIMATVSITVVGMGIDIMVANAAPSLNWSVTAIPSHIATL